MQADLQDQVIEDIRRAYTSLDNPDWSFVTRVLYEQPYKDVIKALSHFCAVEDRTDTNYSVSFALDLRAPESAWTLWLSMVGRYAVLIGAGADRVSRILLSSSSSSVGDDMSSRILQVLMDSEIVALGRSELASPTPLRASDDGTTVPVWRALFLDEDEWPWSV